MIEDYVKKCNRTDVAAFVELVDLAELVATLFVTAKKLAREEMEPWRERLDALCTLLLPRTELARGTLSVLVELYKDRRRQGFTCPPALLTALIEVIERQGADRSVAARACRALAFITAEPQNRAAAGVRAARAVLAAMAH